MNPFLALSCFLTQQNVLELLSHSTVFWDGYRAIWYCCLEWQGSWHEVEFWPHFCWGAVTSHSWVYFPVAMNKNLEKTSTTAIQNAQFRLDGLCTEYFMHLMCRFWHQTLGKKIPVRLGLKALAWGEKWRRNQELGCCWYLPPALPWEVESVHLRTKMQ